MNSVKEFAEADGQRRYTVSKVLKRLGIEPSKSRDRSQKRGQMLSYMMEHDARSVLEVLASSRNLHNKQEGEKKEMPDAALWNNSLPPAEQDERC